MKDSFEFKETLLQYDFVKPTDPSEDVALRATLLRMCGYIHVFKNQKTEAVEAFKNAAVICRTPLVSSCSDESLQQLQLPTLLYLGNLLWRMGKLSEALSTLEEAYNIQCEKTGLPDEYLQNIAINITGVLGDMGELERAEYFSRVTYEMMKENSDESYTSSRKLIHENASR
jgi:tetratricopeptide (TPR) repeat protein